MIDISELDEGALEDILSEPTEATKELIAGLNGDISLFWAQAAKWARRWQ